MRVLAAVLVTAALLITSGCGLYREVQRRKQLRTYTHLETIVDRIERERAAGRGLPDLGRIVGSVHGGLDAWGNPFVYAQKSGQGATGPTYVVASVGADGRLDVDDLFVYSVVQRRSVAWEFGGDIVFRDGEVVQYAGI